MSEHIVKSIYQANLIQKNKEQERLCALENRAEHTRNIRSSPHRIAGKFSHYGDGDGFNLKKTAS
jgi:hypothetical protein